MIPTIVDVNKHRDLQPDTMQRVRDLRTLSPKWVVAIKSFHSRLRAKETLLKMRFKDCNNQRGWRMPRTLGPLDTPVQINIQTHRDSWKHTWRCLHVSKQDGVPIQGGKIDIKPSSLIHILAPKLITLPNKKLVLSSGTYYISTLEVLYYIMFCQGFIYIGFPGFVSLWDSCGY